MHPQKRVLNKIISDTHLIGNVARRFKKSSVT